MQLKPSFIAASIAALAASSAMAQTTAEIAFIGTLTGDFASYGVSGKQGFDLAVEQFNAKGGPQIKTSSVDDRGNPSEGVLASNRFCSNTATAGVVGFSFSSVALAAMPILDKCGLPVIATASTSPQLSGISPFFRRVALTDAIQGKVMAEQVAKKMGIKNVYVLYQQDDYGIGVKDAFKEAYEAAGGKVVGIDPYMLGTKDFRTMLTKIKSKKPEAIFISGFYTEAAAIVSQAKAMRINSKMLGSDGSLSQRLIELSGAALEGMTLYGTFDAGASAASSPVAENFVKSFEAKYKVTPDSWAALGYDAGLAMAAAVTASKAPSPMTRAALHESLSKMPAVDGATGKVEFSKTGDRAASVMFFTVKNGKFSLDK